VARRTASSRTPVSQRTGLVVELNSVTRTYGSTKQPVVALDRVSTAFAAGTFTAVMGPSGSGKSTLLHCAAGLDRPTSGTVELDGIELTKLKENKLTDLRRERIGFVFQAFNLISSLNLWENVTLPLLLGGERADAQWVNQVIANVGLADRIKHRPAQLSGGQQQRVAIARALVTKPAVIFADEPTGSLDTRSAQGVLSLLRRIVDETGQTVVMVTHDPIAASYADTALFLADGRLAGRLDSPSAEVVAQRMTQLGAWAEASA
jgi:putative ABC transport system ATP-binding protein